MKIPRAILVTNKTNISYFSGFVGTNGYLAVMRDARGRIARGALFTDSRYHLIAKASLPRNFELIDITKGFQKPWQDFLRKNRIRQFGVDTRDINKRFWDTLRHISRKGVKIIDVGNTLDRQRIVKSKLELSKLVKAQAITDKIFSALRKALRPGQTEKEIAWMIEKMAHELGADGVSFPAIVGINENSASPHHHPTNKKLRQGDMILIDMGVTYERYCSDMTRVLFTKTPTQEQSSIYELVLRAQENAIAGIKAGITGAAGDKLARSIIEQAGHGDHFGHSLGHGVGMDVHEMPNLSSSNKERLQVGAVVTVEPGVYLPGKFGVRLEDMVVIGAKKVTNITKSHKSLKDCVIRL